MPDNIDELFISVTCYPCRIWEIMNGSHTWTLSCLITMFPVASHSALHNDVPVFDDGTLLSKWYQFQTNKDTVTPFCMVVHMGPLLDIDALNTS